LVEGNNGLSLDNAERFKMSDFEGIKAGETSYAGGS